MAFGKSLELAAIQPPPGRFIVQGATYRLKETAERHAKERAAGLAAKEARKNLPRAFRARKRAWRGKWNPRMNRHTGGADVIVGRMFLGLEAVSL